ncbi:plant cysteine oxidase 2-like [Apium graveolens]|uniref:plant cysteine oxidase 2-like n=1 Tax=Apium graveolens TaxID=4045 RepID=UPI003D7A5A6E
MEMKLINGSGRENRVGYVSGRLNRNKRISTKRCKTQKRDTCKTKNKSPKKILLQRLFESCQQVFRGPGTVPSPPDVQILRQIIDGMQPEDVGLSPELQFFNPLSNAANGVRRVTQTTIYKCQNFSLCIFFLPVGAVIPLHNHPGMTVFSKLLLGTMHIKAYDWVDPVDSSSNDSKPSSKLRLARLKADNVFTAPCDSSVLYPASGGNIHAFTALTPCAVLDVLGPPYSKEDGRDGSYYKDSPYTPLPNVDGSMIKEEEGKLYGWLEEIEMPKESVMDGIEYLGPQIRDFSF